MEMMDSIRDLLFFIALVLWAALSCMAHGLDSLEFAAFVGLALFHMHFSEKRKS